MKALIILLFCFPANAAITWYVIKATDNSMHVIATSGFTPKQEIICISPVDASGNQVQVLSEVNISGNNCTFNATARATNEAAKAAGEAAQESKQNNRNTRLLRMKGLCSAQTGLMKDMCEHLTE